MRTTAVVLVCVSLVAVGQTWKGNHDETKVKPYTLPDPLLMQSGAKVTDAAK